VSSIEEYATRLFEFFPKSGRAVAFPVFKGAFERDSDLTYTTQDQSASYRDHVTMWGKDLARSIDYLETRGDIDTDRLAYVGHSWGGRLGGIMLAVEPRLKVGALIVAGFNHVPTQPEVDPLNYVPRISQPVIMLSGRYDAIFPLETSARPMFDLIGTDTEHKRHVIAETAHSVGVNDVISEVLGWFDRYLGSVEPGKSGG
jgi:pimeloyl-ACP methyl ester carboxylesterase